MSTHRLAPNLALAALLAIACSDSTAPRGNEGRYSLRLVGGRPLPVTGAA